MDKIGNSDYFQQPELSYSITPTEARVEASYEGPWEKVVYELTDNYNHGMEEGQEGNNTYLTAIKMQLGIQTSDSPSSGRGLADGRGWYVTSMRAERLAGGLGKLTVSVIGVRTMFTVGIEFETLSRPILGFVFPNEPIDDAIKRLTKIEQWKNMKDTDHLAEYLRFQYKISSTSKASTDSRYYLVAHSGAAGYARKIAEKVKRGIDSFDRYVPVVTVTIATPRVPNKDGYGYQWLAMSYVGTQGSLANKTQWASILPSSLMDDLVTEMQNTIHEHFGQGTSGTQLTWMVSGDSMTVNEEFIYTRTIQWRGISEADFDLYPDRDELQ